MNTTDIRKRLDELDERAAKTDGADRRLKLFENTLHEISAVLADMLELMQNRAGETAPAPPAPAPLDLGPLVQAIKAMPPPSVSVAAPVSNANSEWRELRVTINRGQYGNGPMESFNITKVK